MSPPQGNQITIFFNGKLVPAYESDTVASALYRNGVRIFSRSFKYHRPRGLLCVGGNCPNCLMNVDGVPTVRACITPVHQDQQVKHQNAYPSLERDYLAIAQRFDWLMPVGFYYKTFTHPRVWHFVEPRIRKVAGLGVLPEPDGQPAPEYDHAFAQADVVVIGGGPAGMEAAVESARSGGQITLIDERPELGGHLRYERAGADKARELAQRLKALPNVEVLSNASCFGLYEGKLLGIVQRRPFGSPVRERLIHLRAKHIVVATGMYEIPRVFQNNDLVGVMLRTGVQRLIHQHAVKPGNRAVVVGPGDPVVEDLRSAGVEVAAVVDVADVLAAVGKLRVTGVRTKTGVIACDLIVVCGERVPHAGLLSQAGAKLEWDEGRGAFIPTGLPSHVAAVGEVTGESLAASRSPTHYSSAKKSFVCYCEDVTSADLEYAIDEGFDHIETLKRYTTVTMGPCQGRMCALPSIGICARQTGRSMGDTGTTTSRPPNPSVSLGALAGPRHHPVKRTPMHYEHDALGAVWMDLGEWKRPRYYKQQDTSEEKACVEREYRAVRERVGIIDVSTLGKLLVTGKDAPQLLDRIYTNRLSNLREGWARYSVVCDDSGIILDDGTVSRLSADEFFVTTTTGNIDFVKQWMEWWAAGTGWCVHVTNVTGGFAAVNVAGPHARDLLKHLTDCDLSIETFPYMAARRANVVGIDCLLMRLGFVGETGWEIHYPAENGAALWDEIVRHGKEFGLQPFGVETQRILRLEKKHVIVGVDTDALSNPLEADMAWIAKLDKDDFIGKAAIVRAQARGMRDKLVGFVMQDALIPEDGSAIMLDGKPVGRVTSARFSPVRGTAVGLAWVPVEAAADGHQIQVHINGQAARAQVVLEQFYDAQGKRLKM